VVSAPCASLTGPSDREGDTDYLVMELAEGELDPEVIGRHVRDAFASGGK
jgi:hypothetical protein